MASTTERVRITQNLVELGLLSDGRDERAGRQHDDAVRNLVHEIELEERWNAACPSRLHPKGE